MPLTLRRPLASCRAGQFALGLTLVVMAAPSALAAQSGCSAQAGARVATVVELYTSQGCESCPPADRWLSKLKARPDVVALAFHVTYWDRLGWKDRFASPAHSQRQVEQQHVNGARFSYTPQVVIDGIDRPAWGTLPMPEARTPATVQLTLAREGERYAARVQAAAGAPTRLAGFWAVTESGHVTAVKAGENRGATLAHDFVVREYLPVPSWTTRTDSAFTLHFSPAAPTDTTHPRELNLVLVDADSGRPVQAVRLGC